MTVIEFPDRTECAIDSVHAEILPALQRLSVVNQTQLLAVMLGEIVAENARDPKGYLRLMFEMAETAASGRRAMSI